MAAAATLAPVCGGRQSLDLSSKYLQPVMLSHRTSSLSPREAERIESFMSELAASQSASRDSKQLEISEHLRHGGAGGDAADMEQGMVPPLDGQTLPNIPEYHTPPPPSLLRSVSRYANELDMRPVPRITHSNKTLSFADEHGAHLQETTYELNLYYSAGGVVPQKDNGCGCTIS